MFEQLWNGVEMNFGKQTTKWTMRVCLMEDKEIVWIAMKRFVFKLKGDLGREKREEEEESCVGNVEPGVFQSAGRWVREKALGMRNSTSTDTTSSKSNSSSSSSSSGSTLQCVARFFRKKKRFYEQWREDEESWTGREREEKGEDKGIGLRTEEEFSRILKSKVFLMKSKFYISLQNFFWRKKRRLKCKLEIRKNMGRATRKANNETKTFEICFSPIAWNALAASSPYSYA